MAVYDKLGDRMKDYEARNQYFLQRRTPVAIRVDMKSGHSFTKGFQRPFDEIFIKSMQQTAKFMCENIQGAILSFQQSDEITIILQDYKNLNTHAWFNYRTDKMCSIAASIATMAFNKFFADEIWNEDSSWKCSMTPQSVEIQQEHQEYMTRLRAAATKGAMFDARVFNIPKEEVANLIYWRQLDATRNSIQMVGQTYFSHKELQGKSCNQIQDMLHEQKGINWNDYPTHLKRGSCCIRMPVSEENVTETIENVWGVSHLVEKTIRHYTWKIDTEIPIFKGDDREYIEKWIWM